MDISIPVITYHTIGQHTTERPWSFLTTPVDIFERQMEWLYKQGYSTITLKEMYHYRTKGKKIPNKAVVLNFDDGFLDNWVVAAEILKAYGFIATVYISTDFVDKRRITRKRLEKTQLEKVSLANWWGYLSWDELRIMQKSGCFDIQGHAKTHTWNYCTEEIVDFHTRGDKYYWLWWNAFPEKKPYWLTEYKDDDIEYGTPVMRYAKALSERQFIVNPDVISFCVGFAKEKGEDYLIHTANKNCLKDIVYKKFQNYFGEFESNERYFKRLEEEIILSKLEAEKKLGKEIDFLAFPGGGQNEISRKMIFEAGYLAVSGKDVRTNFSFQDSAQFNRVGGWSGLLFNNRCISIIEMEYLKLQLDRAQGKKSLRVECINLASQVRRKLYNKTVAKKGEGYE